MTRLAAIWIVGFALWLAAPDEAHAEGAEFRLVLGGDGVVIAPPAGQAGEGPSDLPGRALPVAPADTMAWEVDWDEYRTLIVIEPGEGLRRPVWVATRHREEGTLAVAYAGTAFRDAGGEIHIDCRRAVISGPMARQWSPDSFAIVDDEVRVIDDADRGNRGEVVAAIPAREEPGGALTVPYQLKRLMARRYVEGAF